MSALVNQQVRTDEELMLSVKEGNTKSFEILMLKYKNPLINFIYRMTGNQTLSEDIFQETFLRIYKAADRYEPISKFSTFAYKIATNLAINELKRQRLRRMIPLWFESAEGVHEDLEYQKSMVDNAEPGADELMESAEKIKLVRQGLKKLSPMHRAVLILSEYEERPYEEIASIVGINVGTVKSRIHRAKNNLKEWLKKHEMFKGQE